MSDIIEHAKDWRWVPIYSPDTFTKTLSGLTNRGCYQISTTIKNTYPKIRWIDEKQKVHEIPMSGLFLTYEAHINRAYELVDEHYRSLCDG